MLNWVETWEGLDKDELEGEDLLEIEALDDVELAWACLDREHTICGMIIDEFSNLFPWLGVPSLAIDMLNLGLTTQS